MEGCLLSPLNKVKMRIILSLQNTNTTKSFHKQILFSRILSSRSVATYYCSQLCEVYVKLTKKLFSLLLLTPKNALIMLLYSEPHTPTLPLEVRNWTVLEINF